VFSQNASKFGFMISWDMVIVWVTYIETLENVENAKKSKFFGNSGFWIRKYRFFQKKNPKSGRRGGAEFGIHV
jgi:hypothetical protein